MTDTPPSERERQLFELVANLCARLDDLTVTVVALRLAVQHLLPASEAEFEKLVEILRKRLVPSEDAHREAVIRQWLAQFDGPKH